MEVNDRLPFPPNCITTQPTWIILGGRGLYFSASVCPISAFRQHQTLCNALSEWQVLVGSLQVYYISWLGNPLCPPHTSCTPCPILYTCLWPYMWLCAVWLSNYQAQRNLFTWPRLRCLDFHTCPNSSCDNTCTIKHTGGNKEFFGLYNKCPLSCECIHSLLFTFC